MTLLGTFQSCRPGVGFAKASPGETDVASWTSLSGEPNDSTVSNSSQVFTQPRTVGADPPLSAGASSSPRSKTQRCCNLAPTRNESAALIKPLNKWVP